MTYVLFMPINAEYIDASNSQKGMNLLNKITRQKESTKCLRKDRRYVIPERVEGVPNG